MRRSPALVLIRALVVGAAATAAVVAWWLLGTSRTALDGPAVVVASTEPADVPERPSRAHVDPVTVVRLPGATADAPPPTLDAWLAGSCGDGTSPQHDGGLDVEWWDFPLEDVMAALLAVLESDDMQWSGVRALDEIRSIGYLAAPWADDVARYLRNEALAESARVALAAMGPDAVPVVRKYARVEDPRIRERALLVFAEADYRRREVVDMAIAALDDPDDDVRAAAIEVLAGHTEAPELSVPELAARIPEAADGKRLDVLFALAMYGPRAAEAVPSLVRLLSEQRVSLPNVAVETLEAIGPAAAPAVPTLLARLAAQPDVFVRTVPEAVFAISPDAYLDALSHDDPTVRAAFARSADVGRSDPDSEARLTVALEALLRDPDERVRQNAIQAIAKISALTLRNERAVQALGVLLERSGERLPDDRVSALEAIAAKGPEAGTLAPAAREFLHDADERVRLHAALAVWTVDPPAADVEPILRSYRTHATLRAELYRGLNARPPVAWAEHTVALLSDEPDDSDTIGSVIGMVEGLGAAALDPLVRLSENETRDWRIAMIAELLYEIGEPAVPALRKLADRPGLLPPLRAQLLRLADSAR